MKNAVFSFVRFCSVGGAVLLAAQTQAEPLTFELGDVFSGPNLSSTSPWMVATFTTVQPGTVRLGLQSSLDDPREFFTTVAFNLNSRFDSALENPSGKLQVNLVQGGFEDVFLGNNVFGLPGALGFDVGITFPTGTPDVRLNGSRYWEFLITGINGNGFGSLVAEDFNAFNAGADMKFAAVVSGPSGISIIEPGPSAQVPDTASTLLLLGFSLAVLASQLRGRQAAAA